MSKILELVSDGIFNKKNDVFFEDAQVITSLDKAEVYAFQQFGIDNVWADLKSSQSLVLEYATDEDDYFWTDGFSERIYEQLINTIYEIFINEIDEDLFNCFLNEKYSLHNNFWNMLFNYYYKGVMPCGWQGEYPEGELVVFAPIK